MSSFVTAQLSYDAGHGSPRPPRLSLVNAGISIPHGMSRGSPCLSAVHCLSMGAGRYDGMDLDLDLALDKPLAPCGALQDVHARILQTVWCNEPDPTLGACVLVEPWDRDRLG